MENRINLQEFKNIFNYIVKNNARLVAEGKKPTAIGMEAEAGVGKTSLIEQIAEENNMTFVKLNLSQLDEISDMVGFPIKEYKVYPILDGDEEEGSAVYGEPKWVPNDMMHMYLNAPCNTYKISNESRMSYATPAWLPREENENGIILLLDDYNRCAPAFAQATMELIDRGTYVSWNLPKNTTIVLTNNPDDSDYNITSSLDNAQKTRFINFKIDFDIDIWANWAEKAGIDGRAINFALYYASEIFESKEGLQKINPRSYVTFCNAISGLKDWENTEDLAMILNISKGCFTDEKNIVGNLFTMFIANKLDKLISPEDLLNGNWDTIKTKAKGCVYTDGKYRADVAAVLATRFLNYSMKYFDSKGSKSEVVCDRLLKFVEASEDKNDKIFAADVIFNIAKTLVTKYPARTNKLMMNAKIRKALI